MTPGEKNVLKSLVAVAWADGKVEEGESGVIEGLLSGFDASDTEEAEILEYAKTRRSLEDIPLDVLTEEDRELLVSNAALLTHADGEQSESEKALLDKLIDMLGFSAADGAKLVEAARDGALNLGTKPLEDEPSTGRAPPRRR
jgi:tellurite resistance protein